MTPRHLLATTSKSLLLIDGASGAAHLIDGGRAHYFGISRGLGVYYVGNRGRSNTSPLPKDRERGKVLVFDAELRLTEELAAPFALRDMHQLLFHDGSLWVTCSFDNMVAVFDGRAWREWFPLGPPVAEPRDTHHFNSLTGFGDQLCVLAHNLGALTARGSELHFFTLPDLQPAGVVALGAQAHNVWLHGSELMTCSSGEGRLVGANGTVVETGGFPRGVCRVGGETYVGLSEFAQRADRDDSRGQLLVFDAQWGRRRVIDLDGQGMVTDLLALSAVEAQCILDSGAQRETLSFPVLHDLPDAPVADESAEPVRW